MTASNVENTPEPSLDDLMQAAARADARRWHFRSRVETADHHYREHMKRLMAHVKQHPDCALAGMDRRHVAWDVFDIALKLDPEVYLEQEPSQ